MRDPILCDPSLCAAPAVVLDEATAAFYRDVLQRLNDADAPYLVGGAYAFACYTGIERHTKDLDLFIRRADYERVAAVLADAGYDSEMTFPHWLAKVHVGDAFIDLIFSAGNGVAMVDDRWFEHAGASQVLGIPVKILPPEEMIWSKGFIMERERFDGADVAHLLHRCAGQMDWDRLLERFAGHWRVLLAHLVLFGFIYPGDRDRIPAGVMERLVERLRSDEEVPQEHQRLCGGTLLSRQQYLHDVEQLGYRDGRAQPFGSMTEEDIAHWTRAIPGREAAA